MILRSRWFSLQQSIRVGTAVAAIALMGTACTKVGAPALDGRVNAFTQPHVLRYSTNSDISTLNPWFSQDLTLGYIAEMTMAYLFRYNHSNQPEPELATVFPTKANGGISKNGKVITLHLRHGVLWSDGAPFTASDVVFSIHQVMNPRNNVVSREGWNLIKKIQTPNKYTVRLVLSQPYAEFEPTFFSTGGANPCILPKHLLGKAKELNDAPYNAKPVGIGPFKVAQWNRASSVTLVPNELYWKGVPKLQRVEFKIITKTNTVVEQLQTGDLDLWIPATPFYIRTLNALTGYRVVRQPSYMFSHIDFNMARPGLSDVRVRRALRLALNRSLLHDKISHGFGLLQESYLSPSYPNGPAVIPMLPYNRDAAAALLDKAGWAIGSDGVRQKNGHELRLNVALGPQEAGTDAMIELIRGWWQDIGVAIDVHHYDTNVLFGQYQQHGIINSGKYDVALFSWQVDALDNMLDILGCDSFPPNGQNNTHYCDPYSDRMMKAFNRTYDPVEQKRLKTIVMKRFVKDVPMVVTSIRENLYVVNRDVKGFNPNQVSAFDDMLNVDI